MLALFYFIAILLFTNMRWLRAKKDWLFQTSSGQTLIHLIDRKTGKEVETKYYTGAVVVYHHVNAYEEDGHVIFDVIAYKDNSLYNMFYMSKLKENAGFHDEAYSKPSYKRFVLPLQSDKVRGGVSLYVFVSIALMYRVNIPAVWKFCFGWVFAECCCWREHGKNQIHNSQRCEGERRQTNVPGRGALWRWEITATRMAKVEKSGAAVSMCLEKKMSLYPYQDSSCPELTTTPTARGTALSTAAASKSLRCQNR